MTAQTQIGRLFDGAQTELGQLPLGDYVSVTKPILQQTAWRFFDDNAAMASSTALGTENTQFPVDIVTQSDKRYQLRVQINNTDASVAAASPTYTLQRRFNGGPWEPVTAITTGAEPDLSAFFVTGEATTARLTSPGGTFTPGIGIEGTSSSLGAERAFDTRSPTNTVTGIVDPVEIGNKLTFAVAGQVTHLWHYRPAASPQTAHTLRVWNAITTTLLATATTSGESGTGWVSVALSTPLQVTAGAVLTVSVSYPSGDAYTYRASGASSDDANITHNGSFYNTVLGTFPATVNGGPTYNFFSDVTFAPNLPALTYTELVFCTKIMWAEVVPNDVIEFRVVRDGGPDYMTFTQVPSISVFRSGVSATVTDNWGTWNAAATGKIDKNLITITAVQWCFDDGTPDVSTFTGDSDGRITVPVGWNVWFLQLRIQWRHDGPGFQDASTFTLQARDWMNGYAGWQDLPSGGAGVLYAFSPNYSNSFYMGNVPARLGDIPAALYNGSGRAASNSANTTGNLPQGKYNEYCWCLRLNTAVLNTVGYFTEFRIKRNNEIDNIDYGTFTPKLVLGTWGVPQNVAAVAITGTTTQVTWTAVTGARAYDVWRDGVVIATNHPASPYNDSGLTPGVTYNYQVSAVG